MSHPHRVVLSSSLTLFRRAGRAQARRICGPADIPMALRGPWGPPIFRPALRGPPGSPISSLRLLHDNSDIARVLAGPALARACGCVAPRSRRSWRSRPRQKNAKLELSTLALTAVLVARAAAGGQVIDDMDSVRFVTPLDDSSGARGEAALVDGKKANANLRKHGVSFVAPAQVFEDTSRVE